MLHWPGQTGPNASLIFFLIYCIYEIFGPSVPDICITESVEGKY